MQRDNRYTATLFIGWIVLNMIQAAGMELDPDEAYYWLYSRQLDWGYFDHPPMAALLIKMGYAIIPGELGVRLGAIVLQAAGFIVIWHMLGRPVERLKIWMLALLLAGLPMLQVYGFIATPDGPLLFFTILFFYCYQQFSLHTNWRNTLLLGLMMALLLYSKYHGLLVILFTLFSNLALLKNARFYVASIFGAILFSPHLYWQYAYGFPSISYHLVGRDDIYELKHTTTFLLNQVLILSPLLFPLFISVLRRRSPQDLLERAFFFVIYGFWIFFFLSTFKGHAEPQWTAIISIPLVFLTYRHALINPVFASWLKPLAITTVVFLFAARLFLCLGDEWLPPDFQDQRWIPVLRERAAGKAVVFENSYRDVAKYAFYTKEMAYTFTDVKYRKNQFDIWNWEEQLNGKPALIVGKKEWECTACEEVQYFNKDYKLMDVPDLMVAQKLILNGDLSSIEEIEIGTEITLDLRIFNPYSHNVVFGQGTLPVRPVIYFLSNGVYMTSIPLRMDQVEVPAGRTINQTVTFSVPLIGKLEAGPYQMGVGISLDNLPPVINSAVKNILITGGKK